MSKTEVVMCQRNICKGNTCEHFDRCNHRMYRKEKHEPKTRTCPECGHVNGRDAVDCEACDYPLQF